MPSMHDQLCPTGTLKLGFGSEAPPFVFQSPQGTYRGWFIRFWEEIGRAGGCQSLELVPYSSINLFLSSRLGEVVSTIQTIEIEEKDPPRFGYSVPEFAQTLLIESSSGGGAVEYTPLGYFTVLSLLPFLLLLLGYAASHAIEVVIKTTRSLRPTIETSNFAKIIINILDFLVLVSVSYFLFFTYQIWSSGYTGNSVINAMPETRSMSRIISQIREKETGIVVSTRGNPFSDKDMENIFLGGVGFLRGESLEERAAICCEIKGRVATAAPEELTSFNLAANGIKPKCAFRVVDKERGAPSIPTALTQGTPFSYIMQKNTSHTLTKAISFAQLSFFNRENMDRHLVREMDSKTLKEYWRAQPVRPPKMAASAMTMSSLPWPAGSLVVGLALSLGFFVGEQLFYRKYGQREEHDAPV
ncbi:hypothetical protein PFISCL1PPCAC_28647 [Pristionchus fissidentatus]|uniref:Solute-binding protein family 3/N-terminal domain-containing protein n=1 Tax=Pristionchus fissidentatus TaxID=1538716 RepID=A0AAV5W7L4_9BILA|nr:hypothetical protein PFISCL1PPCAC_17151 [Pristionchus fissidentatus]GMT25856.1 hypothetical protein PFISCL1PPCAC_17153 [Pristionchus fissidentatus]GMT37350.1 hypothetical protein PFISCL1PPCAC_28647 [Pristionchus fissidentatus]